MGTEVTTTIPYVLRRLRPRDRQGMLQLQQRVFDALPLNQRNFIALKKPGDYDFFFGPHGFAAGLFHNSTLIGQTLLSRVGEHQPRYGIGGSTDAWALNFAWIQSQVVQSVLIDPDAAYRGQGLMQHMLRYVEEVSVSVPNGRVLLAKAAMANQASIQNFLKFGYNIVLQDFDNSDGRWFAVLRKVSPIGLPPGYRPGRPLHFLVQRKTL